jgi:hypothetical protein
MYQPGSATHNLRAAITENAKKLAEASYSVTDSGLYAGKAGILLSLYNVHNQLKGEDHTLIDAAMRQLQEDISEQAANADDSFDNGIFGIGWAISTLYEQGNLSESEVEVMNSIDDELYKLIMYQKCDTPCLEQGTMGRINYYLKRINEQLERSNKYRYVSNYECLMLLIDDFTNENEKDIDQMDFTGSDLSLLHENGRYYANVFNLLSRLVERGIHPEITERQLLRLLRIFVKYFDSIKDNPVLILENEKKYWDTVAVVNCLLQMAQESEALAERLNSGQRFIQEIVDRNFDSLVNVQQFTSIVSGINYGNRFLAKEKISNLIMPIEDDKINFGLNGFAGFLFLANEQESNRKVIHDAFLI